MTFLRRKWEANTESFEGFRRGRPSEDFIRRCSALNGFWRPSWPKMSWPRARRDDKGTGWDDTNWIVIGCPFAKPAKSERWKIEMQNIWIIWNYCFLLCSCQKKSHQGRPGVCFVSTFFFGSKSMFGGAAAWMFLGPSDMSIQIPYISQSYPT